MQRGGKERCYHRLHWRRGKGQREAHAAGWQGTVLPPFALEAREGAARGPCSGVARNGVTTVCIGGEGRGSERPMQRGGKEWCYHCLHWRRGKGQREARAAGWQGTVLPPFALEVREGAVRGPCSGRARNGVTTVCIGGNGRGSERPV